MTSDSSWSRLIRFKAPSSNATLYGQPIGDHDDLGKAAESGNLQANVVQKGANGLWGSDTRVTDKVEIVGTLLGPLDVSDVAVIKCIGLNYKKHIAEGGRSPPPYPSLFLKSPTSVGDYGDETPIPKIAQEGEADYEIELVVVIGKDAKDVSPEDALEYVAGYTIGNDVSARKWQKLPERAGNVPQWCFAKGFDKWAPLGPALVSPSVIKDPGQIELKLSVNGEVRQQTMASDLLFDVPAIISFLSQGSTLQKGTVIFTGTPSGCACMGPMDKWRPLVDGDKLELSGSGIGTLRHSIKYI